MSDPVAAAREGHAEEMRSAQLYEALSRIETDARIAQLFRQLGGAAEEQAQVWAGKLVAAGEPVPAQVDVGAPQPHEPTQDRVSVLSS